MSNNCASGQKWIWMIIIIFAVLYFCGGGSNLFGNSGCGEQYDCSC